MNYSKTLQNQIKKAGFNIDALPKNIPLHFKHSSKFVNIPIWVMELANENLISSTAFKLYVNIAGMCYGNKSYTWISRAELAHKTGMSIRTIYYKLNELVDVGMIAIFTQMVNQNKSKSLIFILSERNTIGMPDYISSMRHPNNEQKENKRMKNSSVGACKKLQLDNEISCSRLTEENCRRISTTIESIQGNNTREEYDPTHFFPQEKNDFDDKAGKLINKYYKWLYKKFGVYLKPRKADISNAIELVSRKGAEPDTFLKFIRESAHDPYFIHSDKHFSVWTSDIAIAKYSTTYRDIFIN